MVQPATLSRDVSPPPLRKKHATAIERDDETQQGIKKSKAAAIEAHEVFIRDHLTYFVQHLSAASRPSSGPRITIEQFANTYTHANGAHFVIHQHDHPVAGVHYDLRLQFNETSTVSWAIPYGLPGNPNSLRPNRMAIETRVHNLWNNLIESASHATGSLLIWDTGVFEVLDRPQPRSSSKNTDDELSDTESQNTAHEPQPQHERLITAFQSRHIHLRLHGTRLPKNYTIAMRLPSHNDRTTQPRKPARKRRRIDPAKARKTSVATSSDDDDETIVSSAQEESLEEDHLDAANASEDDEDSAMRINNAYSGASNTIGSIHQRHWFVTLDRQNCGFRKARTGSDAGRWVGDWEAFYVRGREHERSIVTGRNADEVMADNGVKKFMGRKMWRPITE